MPVGIPYSGEVKALFGVFIENIKTHETKTTTTQAQREGIYGGFHMVNSLASSHHIDEMMNGVSNA